MESILIDIVLVRYRGLFAKESVSFRQAPVLWTSACLSQAFQKSCLLPCLLTLKYHVEYQLFEPLLAAAGRSIGGWYNMQVDGRGLQVVEIRTQTKSEDGGDDTRCEATMKNGSGAGR